MASRNSLIFFVLIAFHCVGGILAISEMPLMTTGWKSYDVVKDQPAPSPSSFLGFFNYTSTESYNFQQLLYLAEIGFGTPSQTATLLFDSGSSNLWIMGTQCHETGCDGKTKFNEDKSSTFHSLGEPLTITYGSGYIEGFLANDEVTFGDMTIKQTFGVVDNIDAGFAGSHFSGICGMSYQALAADNVTPPLTNMVKQGKISNFSFSLHLSKKPQGEGSKIIFGGNDPTLFKGDLTYFDNVGDDFFAVNIEGIKIGSQQVPLERKMFTIVDSGTTIIAFPSNMIGTVENMIGHVEPDCSNVGSLPDLFLDIEGTTFSLTSEDYVVVMEFNGRYQCTLPFVEQEQEYMIIGVMFMRKYYTHFDLENRRIGFAENIQQLSPLVSPPDEMGDFVISINFSD